MSKIELLLAYEDGTWTTEVVDCPADVDRDDYNDIDDWIHRELCGQAQYRKVVLFAVYNTDPEHDTGDLRLGEDVEQAN